jgi:glyoxylase-like metal-dependent hydrolase (beta-lactamase superfamily II)
VTISHAHNDHYQGVFLLPDRDRFQVWTQARVAVPLGEPYLYCAPYLDARPLTVDLAPADGQTIHWHEHALTFHHLPGQTEFAMGIEAAIDGRRCFFTGDNFYHADQFSGSGGWSGRNRGLPLPYAASAQKVLDAAPDWVLAEHGGAFEFNREDFDRRVRWAREAALAADALSPSGDHRRDWDPQRIHIEPLLRSARRGERVGFEIVVTNHRETDEELTIDLDVQVIATAARTSLIVPAGQTLRRELVIMVAADAAPGLHVLPFVALSGNVVDGSDTFCVMDVAE